MPAGDIERFTQRLHASSDLWQADLIIVYLGKALSGCGSERNSGDQFGVITKPHTLPGISPGPVKDILSVAVRLEVSGYEPHQRPRLLEANMCGLPAGFYGGATRCLEACQKVPA